MVVSMLMLDFEEIGIWNVVGLLSDVMDGFELSKEEVVESSNVRFGSLCL